MRERKKEMDGWDSDDDASEASRAVQRCRHDPLTKQGDVLDVVRLVTGCSRGHAGGVLQRVLADDTALAKLPVADKALGGRRRALCMHLDHLQLVAEALLVRRACLPPSVTERHGVVYAVTSPLLSAVKVGMWRGSQRALRKRYVTVYGDDLTLECFDVDDCRRAEKDAHEGLRAWHLTNELFAPPALEAFRAWCAERGYSRTGRLAS